MAQTALITGASRGIGRETALLLARQGIRIAVHYRVQREKAEALVRCPASVGRGCVILSGRRCRPGTGNEHDA